MTTKPHTCGHPITIEYAWNGLDHVPHYFDGTDNNDGRWITNCPGCTETIFARDFDDSTFRISLDDLPAIPKPAKIEGDEARQAALAIEAYKHAKAEEKLALAPRRIHHSSIKEMTMGNQLAVRMAIDDTINIGQMLAESGFFPDARAAAQAVAKILAGQELGFGPMAAMTGIYIVKGKVTLSANLLAAAIKRSRKYDYIIRRLDDQACKIAFVEFQGDATFELGESTFTIEDAKQAGLLGGDNWRKYRRNMLFARAISNGQKWFCPDILGGPLYTPDELGLPVDDDGETAPQSIREDARLWLEEKAEEQGPDPDEDAVEECPNDLSTSNNGKQTNKPKWNDNANTIVAMFQEANRQFGLAQEDVLLALLVDDPRAFDGTKTEAWQMIEAYAARTQTDDGDIVVNPIPTLQEVVNARLEELGIDERYKSPAHMANVLRKVTDDTWPHVAPGANGWPRETFDELLAVLVDYEVAKDEAGQSETREEEADGSQE